MGLHPAGRPLCRGTLHSPTLHIWAKNGLTDRVELLFQHPVEEFVPKVVHEKMPVVYMPRTLCSVEWLINRMLPPVKSARSAAGSPCSTFSIPLRRVLPLPQPRRTRLTASTSR